VFAQVAEHVRLAKDLIILRAGKNSLHHTWFDRDNSPRSWELLVCPCEEIPPQPPELSGVLVSEVVPAPAKWAALKLLLNDWRDWRDYRYMALVDDDLIASQQTWTRFFERCAQFGAKLAQPALLEDSFFSHSVTVRNTEFMARRVSYVEIMMPCFRTDVFSELLPTLDQSESGEGWGLDFLWSKKLGYKDIFVVDETTVLHTRSLRSHGDPELHKKLNAEMVKIMQANQVPWLQDAFRDSAVRRGNR